MIPLLELLKRTTEFFEKRGVPNAKRDAEEILARGLCLKKRLDLYLQFEREVGEGELERLRPLVKRRGEREPLQYILGDVEWGALRLKVDRRCLVPRHETEGLWEKIVEERKDSPPKTILDLGTGSGALAIALKKSFPAARVTAVERNAETLSLAKENAALNELVVEFLEGDWFSPLSADARFDLIVSNPPYLTDVEWDAAQPEVKAWEPREALTALDDGFADLACIIREAKPRLLPQGELWVETGIAHAPRIEALAKELGYASVAIYKDSSGRNRFARLAL